MRLTYIIIISRLSEIYFGFFSSFLGQFNVIRSDRILRAEILKCVPFFYMILI